MRLYGPNAFNNGKIMKKILLFLLLSMNLSASQELLDAAKSGNLSKVEELVKKDKGSIEFRDLNLLTPLMWAAIKGHAAVAKFLLDREANIEAFDGIGNTALMLAASEGHPAVVNLLLSRGANRSHLNQVSQNAVSMALMGLSKQGSNKMFGSKKGASKKDFGAVAKLLLAGQPESPGKAPEFSDSDAQDLIKITGEHPKNLLITYQDVLTKLLPLLITTVLPTASEKSKGMPGTDFSQIIMSYLDADDLVHMVTIHVNEDDKVVVNKLNPGLIGSFLKGAKKYLKDNTENLLK